MHSLFDHNHVVCALLRSCAHPLLLVLNPVPDPWKYQWKFFDSRFTRAHFMITNNFVDGKDISYLTFQSVMLI